MSAYQPSERICRLRARVLAQPPGLYWAYWPVTHAFTAGWMAAEGDGLSLRSATAFAHVVETMPPCVTADDLLAGDHGMSNDTPGHFWGGPWADDALRAHLRETPLTPEQQAELFRWLETRPFAFKAAAALPHPPGWQAAWEHGVVEAWGTDLNHSIRGYDKVLRLGFCGLLAEVEAALDAVSSADPDAAARRANLLGWQRLCTAACTLGPRHAAEARRLGLDTLAEVCDRVPTEPARTFREAVQALWFAHMLTAWEDGLNANGIGRIDQLLAPYYAADLAAGRLTRDDAAELLAALWIKLYQPYDVQQMMIGGQDAAGRDATNDVSDLVLDVTEGLGFVRCLSARLHNGSPRSFVARCVDLVAQGGGIPFFFNDEALVPALVGKGIPLEDARGYAAIGCIEITIPGKASPHAVSHWINLAKCLELALHDGVDPRDGVRVGPPTGTLADFRDMDDVRAAFTRQLTHAAELAVGVSNAAEIAHRGQYRLPYLSLLTDDCVRAGRDIIEGGARYNYHSSAAMGIPNVADSLAALEQAVFTDGTVSREALLAALRDNFQDRVDLAGYLRTRLPKYGNDHPLPDRYAAELVEQYCTLLGSYRTPTGGTFFAHLFTFTLMLPFGKQTGATPDGRRTGEPLAYSLSPVQGRDREGLTAVINSLARLPHHLAAASSSAILEADPALLDGDGRAAFTDLLITATRAGVGQLQFNVVSADTLRAAQRDPARYQNLCVRVSGFSQQFGLLDAEMQEHIIARTKHRG
jgi:formate C-acetyltransferase